MEIDFRKKRYVLDGGMGTMLQSAGMSPEETTTEFGLAHPEILKQERISFMPAPLEPIGSKRRKSVNVLCRKRCGFR